MGDPAFPDGDGFLDGMRAVLMALPGIGVLFDREGRLVWGNEAFAARYGAQGDDIASRHLTHLEARIAKLQALADELRHVVHQCRGGKAADCQIIQTLYEHHPTCHEHGCRDAAAER